MRDSTIRQYHYPNAFTLKWQNTEPQGLTDMPDWVCSVRDDVMNFTISPVVVQQVGLGDDVPKGFI